MNFMEKISVIVPVYQVEPYLDRCVQSICGQTYQNLEIILVDDGSPDRCGDMCDAYARKDSRIRVIHQENQGLSAARNAGLALATGDYIAFVDSDDWIDPIMFSLLHRISQTYGADIVECDVRSYTNSTIQVYGKCSGRLLEMTPAEALGAQLDFTYCKPMVWNKLYRRHCVDGVQFPVGKVHEDEFTTHKFYMAAEKIVYVDMALYNYERRNPGSITASFKMQNLQTFDAFRERMYLIWSKPELSCLYGKISDAYCWVLFDLLEKCRKYEIQAPEVDRMLDCAEQDYPELLLHGLCEGYADKFRAELLPEGKEPHEE